MNESVWDYPRPPRVEHVVEAVRRDARRRGDRRLDARSPRARDGPSAVYYVPLADLLPRALEPAPAATFCEWKGRASYFDVLGGGGRRVERAAWTYLDSVAGVHGDHEGDRLLPGEDGRVPLDGEA